MVALESSTFAVVLFFSLLGEQDTDTEAHSGN